VEIRDGSGARVLELGDGAPLDGAGAGCASRGDVRVCGRRRGQLLILAARGRTADVIARNRLLGALAAAALATARVVAPARRWGARRVARRLAELGARVAAIEPGSGQRVGVRLELVELDRLAARFDDLVTRFDDALAREKRFAGQASHELRTPLT